MKDALELNPTLEIDQNAKVDQNAIDQSEFTTLSIPILFPDYVRDPTNLSAIRSISDDDIDIDDIETFAAKLKYLVKFAEKIQGKWHCRFACHPKFSHWAYVLYRKQLLSQGNFYKKQHSGDLPLTIDEHREMLQNKNYSQMMIMMQYYDKKISGTNCYWY